MTFTAEIQTKLFEVILLPLGTAFFGGLFLEILPFAVRGCLLKFQTHEKLVSWFVKHFQISNYAKSQILKENGSDVTKIFIAKMLLMDLHQSSR